MSAIIGPAPQKESECKKYLEEDFPQYVTEHIKVRQAINDYLRGQSDPSFRDTYPTWGSVAQVAADLFPQLLYARKGLRIGGIPDDSEDDILMPDPGNPPTDDNSGMHVGDILTPADWERMKAICAYCAKDAAEQPSVIRFRETCLPNSLLTQEECSMMLESRGLGFFTVKDLIDHGVPLTSPSEFVDSQEDADGTLRLTMRFLGTGVTMTTTVQRRELLSPSAKGIFSGIQVLMVKDSVLWWLQAVGDRIADDYKWTQSDAYIFLLTGGTPVNLRIEASCSNIMLSASPWSHGLTPWPIRGMISLQVPCWLTQKQVARIYDHLAEGMQRRFRKKENSPASLAGRPPDAKSIRLFAFVEAQRNGMEIRGEWSIDEKKEIQRRWNTKCREEGRAEDEIHETKRFVAKYKSSTRYREQLTGWTQASKEAYDALPDEKKAVPREKR